MVEPKAVKKRWEQESEDQLSKNQKVLIVSFTLFIPFLFLVIIPMLVRNHYVKQLKIPEEVFLSPPQKIFLVKTSPPPATYKVKMNGITFRIPENYTPTEIKQGLIEFRPEPRRISRTITIASLKEAPKLKFSVTGFARWFLPRSQLKFLQMTLRATWHPIRLMFKAQLFTSEAITGKIFEARWDAHHRGFIFPSPSAKGYIGRIFQTNGPNYFEFAMVDQVSPVSLRKWVDIAMKIKPPLTHKENDDWIYTSPETLNGLISRAKAPQIAPSLIGTALTKFLDTNEPSWLIPIVLVMNRNHFYPEVLDLHKQFLPDFPIDSPHKAKWNSLFDETVKEIISLEIDPSLNKKRICVYTKNLTNLTINQAFVKFILKYPGNIEKSFMAKLLLNAGSLLSKGEKKIYINTPKDISLTQIEGIGFRVMQVDFDK